MPGVTEPTLALVPRAKYRHASAAPLAGLINLHPLHSISLQFRRLHFRSIRSDGRKLPRPSKTAVRPKIPETARLRPAKTSAIARDASHGQDTAIRREAPPVAEDTVVGREASPGQNIGNSREHGHFPDATLRWRSVSPPGRMADLTDKTKLV